MKWFIYILMLCLTLLIGYNITVVDFQKPFEGDSIVALITILCGLCGLLLLIILLTSKKIKETIQKR